VYAETNSPDGYAGYFDGKMKVTAPFFGRPAYDSGWIALSPGDDVDLTHGLGGDPDNYFVDLQEKAEYMSATSIHNQNIGMDRWENTGATEHYRYGAYWGFLNDTTITVYRGSDDLEADEIRIRIWVYE
jgi:hypothetical protein